MSIRYVLFDMDGVLVDVSRSYRRAIEETAALFIGRPVEPGTVQRFKNRGGFNDDWRLTEAIVREAGVDVLFDDIVQAFDGRYRGANWDGYILDERPLIETSVLDQLRNRYDGLGIATGRPREEALFALRQNGWEDLFDVVVPLEDQGSKPKPDPYPIVLALDRLWGSGGRRLPAEAVYVGDSVDDMRAARAANVYAIGFEPPYLAGAGLPDRLRSAGAHVVINDHGELARTLDSLGILR